MQQIFEPFWGYVFPVLIVGIILAVLLPVAGLPLIGKVTAYAVAAVATVVAVVFIGGLPELFGWLPAGTFFFPKDYQFGLYHGLVGYQLSNAGMFATVALAMIFYGRTVSV